MDVDMYSDAANGDIFFADLRKRILLLTGDEEDGYIPRTSTTPTSNLSLVKLTSISVVGILWNWLCKFLKSSKTRLGWGIAFHERRWHREILAMTPIKSHGHFAGFFFIISFKSKPPPFFPPPKIVHASWGPNVFEIFGMVVAGVRLLGFLEA